MPGIITETHCILSQAAEQSVWAAHESHQSPPSLF